MLQLGAPSPIGVGTPKCEALSSFVQRTAALNGTFPGQLVHRILGWVQVSRADALGTWQHHPRRVYLGRNINAFDLALVWRELLAKVARGPSLVHLTANQWDHGFPTRGFLHSTLHWCPPCLVGDKIPYHRLLWMLRPVTVCIEHGCMLVSLCPRCLRAPPVVHERSHPELCPWCAWDLRRVSVVMGHQDDRPAFEIGAIIAHFGRTPAFSHWSSHTAIGAACRLLKLKNPAQLADAAGVSKLTAWYWWTGRAHISLPMALHLSARLGFSLSAAVVAGEGDLRLKIQPSSQTIIHLRSRKPAERIDWALQRKALTRFLKVPLNEAPTFIGVSESLAINRRTLRSGLPKLCRAISERYRRRLHSERQTRHRELRRSITKAIALLRSVGRKPEQVAIEQALQRPGLFNRHYAREALISVLDVASDRGRRRTSP